MKYLLLPLLLFTLPSMAIADNLPANYMILRDGKIINLDHLWGKGVLPVITTQPTAQPTVLTESREVRDNKQRAANDNARNLVLIERLQNMP
jgi:hypothetical protein